MPSQHALPLLQSLRREAQDRDAQANAQLAEIARLSSHTERLQADADTGAQLQSEARAEVTTSPHV